MRILVVGAGSVGQVYGHHLQRSGAHVSVYVREKYAEEARAGFWLYPGGRPPGARFVPDAVHTDLDAAAAAGFDQLWLCVSSTAIRGPLLDAVAAALGDATLVALQPGLRDRELLAPLVPADRLVLGLIAFSAWHAPLPGGPPVPAPGQGVWFPPFSPSTFEGPQAAAVVAALRSGGCPATVGDATVGAARGSALLIPMVAAMECAAWSFSGLRSGRWAALAAGAGREALDIGTGHLGVAPGPARMALRPTAIRLATRVVPLVAPMDFERFLQVHFSKVGDQTLLALDTWIAAGVGEGRSVGELRALRDALRAARGQQPVA